jgi:hypothetical protein
MNLILITSLRPDLNGTLFIELLRLDLAPANSIKKWEWRAEKGAQIKI